MAAEMVRRNFFLPNELHDKAVTLARRKGVKTADVIRTALEKYLQAVERAEKAAQEARNGA
jgi:predicted DNA-binding protein